MLETFTVNVDEYDGPPEGFFTNNDYERFVRLVVNEEDMDKNILELTVNYLIAGGAAANPIAQSLRIELKKVR